METKQTAVIWLEDKINTYDFSQGMAQMRKYIMQAKAMEKEQIIDAYEYGYWRGNNEDDFEPEEYYKNPYCNPNNESYGKQLS